MMNNIGDNDIWVLINQKTKEILGLFSTRDKALQAGNNWLANQNTDSTYSVKAWPTDELKYDE